MFYIKALHIIFIVTWFSGMFYIVRLFIYNTEAQQKSDNEKKILSAQFKIMQIRLWKGITVPSAIATAILGPLTLWKAGYLENFGLHTWLHIKLLFVILLYVYFFSLRTIFKQQQKGIFKWTSIRLRVWNEVATIFLVSITFLVVVKSTLSWVWGLFGLVLFIILLMASIRVYKIIRQSKRTHT